MSFESLFNDWQTKRYREACRAEDYLKARQTPRSTSILAPPDLRQMYYTPLRWCHLITGALEERLSIEDVVTSSKVHTAWLQKTWKALDGDLISSQVHWQSGGSGRAYVSVVDDGTGSPRMAVHSAKSTVHRRDVETGELVEALYIYDEGRRAAHYEVGRTTYYVKAGSSGWAVAKSPAVHGYPRLQIVVFSHRAPNGYGEPWAREIWGLQDAATRVATDGAIAGALMAVPQRVILGATPQEQKQPTEKLYLSRLLTLSSKEAKIEQFAAAQLQQFGTLLNMYARQAASVTGIPVQHFGITSEANPTSGDSKREDALRINTRAERIARDMGSSWGMVLRLLLDFYPATVSDAVRQSARVVWAKGSKPSPEAMGDIGVKLAQAQRRPGEPMFSRYFILQQMGLPETEIQAELERVEEDRLAAMIGEGGEDDDPGNPPDDE